MKNIVTLKLSDDPSVISGVASGAMDGRQAVSRLIERLSGSDGKFILLDFDGVHAATGSYLRELLVGLRNFVVHFAGTGVLLLTGMSRAVEDEVSFLAASLNDVFLAARKKGKSISDVHLVGSLDAKQAEAFDAVEEFGEVDATTLSKSSSEEIRPTAWNNRLSALREKGLVVEIRYGRQKKYRTAMEAING